MSILSKPYFHDEAAAIAHLEDILWADGPVCPHCEAKDRSSPMKGKSTRPGLRKCYACRKQFTVKVGTVFESSHIPLHIWLQATYLMCSSKKGISAHQLHRTLEVTYKTAWFMAHRVREAMKVLNLPPMGDDNTPVQADETYIGKRKIVKKRTIRGKPSHSSKMSIVGLVSGGKARTFHVDRADTATIGTILRRNINPTAQLHTDESYIYRRPGREFAAHKTVKHTANEWVKDGAHTNTIENYFSVFKRGMRGVYQHCSEKHLHRYLSEFDFRYNSRDVVDGERTEAVLAGIKGKRLLYKAQSC